MHQTLTCTLFAAVLASAPVIAAERATAAVEPTSRTVHVTVHDGKGVQVEGLTPADFVVKEGGKEREVAKAEAAPARMRLALAVEERMVVDGSIRVGLFEFMKRAVKAADISLVVVGLSNTTAADYTSNMDTLVGAINKLTLNPRPDSNLAEGVLELADRFASSRPERPVIVVVSMSGGQTGVESRTVLDKLRQSGATMHAVTLAGGDDSTTPVGSMRDMSGREEILGDGPKQSGGRRIDVPSPNGIAKALQQVGDELLAQYAITYTLPDGVKPDKRFSISVKRRGVTLRAPSAIPDR